MGEQTVNNSEVAPYVLLAFKWCDSDAISQRLSEGFNSHANVLSCAC